MPLNIDWQQILLHLLNFLILAVGLYLLLYKPVKAFMKKREDSYAEREKKTEEALRGAEKSRSEYEDKLARADEEIADIRKQASAEIETVRAAKLRDAQSEAETIVAAARDKARKEHDRMIAELGSDIRDLVNDMAEKAVMSPGVDDAYEKFLQEAEKEEEDGKDLPMAGVLPGEGKRQKRLVRFGYARLTAKEDSLLFRAGEEIPIHEFHYWDSTENGEAFEARKPVTGRSWECGFATPTLYAGFPHLYFAGNPRLAQRFADAAAQYQEKQKGD